MSDSRLRLLFLVLIFWSQENAGVYAKNNNISAFTNVNLVPMTAETIIPNQTVLVKDSRIIAIGPSKHIAIPKDSYTINGSNAYSFPRTTWTLSGKAVENTKFNFLEERPLLHLNAEQT